MYSVSARPEPCVGNVRLRALKVLIFVTEPNIFPSSGLSTWNDLVKSWMVVVYSKKTVILVLDTINFDKFPYHSL